MQDSLKLNKGFKLVSQRDSLTTPSEPFLLLAVTHMPPELLNEGIVSKVLPRLKLSLFWKSAQINGLGVN